MSAGRRGMRRAAPVLAGLGFSVSLALGGCEDKVVQSTFKPSPTASASAAASASGRAASLVRPPIDEADFTESDRSRDPFRSFARSFAEEGKARVGSQREVVLPEYSIDELKLIGIVTRIEPAKAMLLDPTGKGHVVRRGQFIGRPDVVQGAGARAATYEVNWRVDRIRDGDIVFVREDPTNPDVPSLTRVIPLRPEDSVEKKRK